MSTLSLLLHVYGIISSHGILSVSPDCWSLSDTPGSFAINGTACKYSSQLNIFLINNIRT